MNNERFQICGRVKYNNRGLTLTELLVATILMGIVMLGIISVDYGIKQMSKSTSNTAFLKMYTSATLQDIARNASLITGNSTDPGFLINPKRFYFRQDINATTQAANNTPADTSDDAWICYDQSQGGANSVNIYRCRFNSPVVTTKDCFDVLAIGRTTIGTAVDSTLDIQGIVDNIAPTQKYYLEISITNRKDPSLAADPLTNPEVTLSTRVDPVSRSWSLP